RPRPYAQPLTLLQRPERRFEHCQRLGAHRNIPAVAGVQSRQFAIGKEAGEARLGVAHPSLAALERRLSAAEAEQLAGRPERIEVSRLELRRHRSHSARWYGSATP